MDFYVHVTKMHDALQAWHMDASDLLEPDCPSLFPVPFNHKPQVLQSLLALERETITAVKPLLASVCGAFAITVRRQLGDFLPSGKYYNVQDPALREKLAHSKVTNLIAEESFAVLDSSLT